MNFRLVFTLLFLFFIPLKLNVLAHPHSHVVQHAFLSINQGALKLKYRIFVPKDAEAEIYALIDTDRNQKITNEEAISFGNNIISKSLLLIDGNQILVKKPEVQVPDFELLATGMRVLTIQAVVSIHLANLSNQKIQFEVTFDDLSHRWILQPFLQKSILNAYATNIERSKNGNRIELSFTAKR